MAKIAIAYHSGYGHTKKQAEAVAAGAQAAGAEVSLISVADISDADWATLEAADAIIFGAPTYMGSVSGVFKVFADASSKPWFQQKWKNKIAAGFTNSASMNGDKYATVQYLWTLAMQHGMIWVGTGLLPANSKAATRNDINYLAGFGGAFAQSPSDASPDEGPLAGDLETAKLFAARVVEVTEQFIKGRTA
ncbi:flavodoxin family protein [Agitococcus lubricus]|uniref:NAD(P)H dehydrogenase (Quinone) n=1 Tax=Agitococcus lubricus TaxID=1077255 RepID=A0A2T5IVM1_9GAMM|nr:flavodoxin family protein [Agitococcus lubricus]PTQ87931.1 NAD(P)H dehydrogenase (quinone) [Agitococcus lubricus]